MDLPGTDSDSALVSDAGSATAALSLSRPPRPSSSDRNTGTQATPVRTRKTTTFHGLERVEGRDVGDGRCDHARGRWQSRQRGALGGTNILRGEARRPQGCLGPRAPAPALASLPWTSRAGMGARRGECGWRGGVGCAGGVTSRAEEGEGLEATAGAANGRPRAECTWCRG